MSKFIPSLTKDSSIVSISNNLSLFDDSLYPVTSISNKVDVTVNPPNGTSNFISDLFNQLSLVIHGFLVAFCLWSSKTC